MITEPHLLTGGFGLIEGFQNNHRKFKNMNPKILPRLGRCCCLLVATFMLCQVLQAQTFVHPGGLHTSADYQRMAAKVTAGSHPWIDSYNQLISVPEAQTNWGWAPVGQIFRCGSGCINNYARSQKDALAIYYNALRYQITGDANYANHAIQGMDAWSSTMTNTVGGDSNFALGVGLCGEEFALAGEALRGYSGWSQTSINNYKTFLLLFYEGNHAFLTQHNGTCDSHYRCNWDADNISSMAAIGVFCDDTNIFNEAVNYFKTGIGNGNITRAAWYIHNDGTAQWEESGRDQAHTMDGLGALGYFCQVAWNQGLDMWGYDNSRYLRGAEYIAKYNLGNSVPYVMYMNCDVVTEPVLGYADRGGFPEYWDMIYGHYVQVMGMAAPYTTLASAQARPDGFYNNPNSPDFFGFSTLTCYRDPFSGYISPSGLVANVIGHAANLYWWGSAYATSYNIKRSTASGGPYTTIGSAGPNDTHFVDGGLASGTTYYYVVSAITPSGETANSAQETATTVNIIGPYYKFNESSGAVASDSSGFGLNATLVNGPTWVPGYFGNAVSLNGATQYVAMPAQVIQELGDFTVAAWVDLSAVTAWNRIFDMGVNAERYMFLSPEGGTGGPVRFSITTANGRAEEQINSTATLGAGNWHHLAVTLTGNEGVGIGTLYIDGTPVATNSTMSHTPQMIGNLVNDTNNWIGRSQFSDPYLAGTIDDFRIYNGALNAAGISAIMAGTNPPTQPGPPPAPSAPSGLAASAVSSSQINLSWSASTGTTSYNVKRATASGGPYVIVGNVLNITNGVEPTSFVDAGLSDGTMYFYVVTAVGDGGESANSSQVSATPPVPSMVDYWRFDETSGTTATDSVGSNNGTLAAGAVWSSAGKFNGCISLNGTSTSYLTLPTGVVSTLNDFSITAWVNLNANATWARLFDFGTGTTNYMFLAPSSGSSVRFAINIGAGEQQLNGSAILPTGGWHHVAVTLSGTTNALAIGTLYIDGLQAGPSIGMTLNPSSLGATTLNYIGRSQFSGDPYLNGSVDDLRIYNGALSASEVAALAGGAPPPPIAPTGLAATAGDTVVNLSWAQSTTPGITGNNVYRSTTGSGGPYNLLTRLGATTSYSDRAVVNGNTYYYSVTATNVSGESPLSAYSGSTPIASMLAYLKFDETSGTNASDSTGNGWTGALINGPTWVAGHLNNAVSLNGTNQYVKMPAGLISGLTNFTISTWVNPTTVVGWNRIFDFGNNTTNYMFLTAKAGSTGPVRFAITTSGNAHEQQINGTAALSSGVWSHVVVTLSGTVGVLYVNNTAVGTNSAMTLNPSNLGSTANNFLGKSQFNDPYLDGLLDDFRIYKGSLTALQISGLP